VKLHNCGCSYCVATGCSQDRKEAQQQQPYCLPTAIIFRIGLFERQYTVSQEVHTTPSGCSNSDLRDQILVIFLADVTKKVVHHTMLCFPSATAPMPGETEIH